MKSIATKIIHEPPTRESLNSLSQPIYQTSTFSFKTVEEFKQTRFNIYHHNQGFNYTRISNPTNDALERKIACLEGAQACLVTGSGMGSIASTLFTFLKSGDHVIVDTQIYDGTEMLFKIQSSNFNITVSVIDLNNLQALKNALNKRTKVVYFETPTNPQLKINDIQSIATIVHNYSKGIKVIIDGTITSPYLQTPISYGADLVIHSLSKYINGHGDVIGGAVCGKQTDINKIRFHGVKYITGSVISPHDAFLILRGIKTLNLRMQQHCDSALKVATFLQSQNKYFKKVLYPGLSTHQNHLIAKKQMTHGFGGLISFEINGSFTQAISFVNHLKLFGKAVSLGDSESLVYFPTAMSINPKIKKNTFIRFSIGLEDPTDLINDIKNAIKKTFHSSTVD
ncbi:MAG: aminotransferase class I/II-fold pyridoxal phosphate-dependent enzyme [Mycoplasmataceae bacterium]|jgi:methionine-gamma-lyase|nr:aminotransferase class I/II-fold pyridoxal phosphate-dependent enzyme [Mycoplasmataceae bacterium]